jgi:hypothetical protein
LTRRRRWRRSCAPRTGLAIHKIQAQVHEQLGGERVEHDGQQPPGVEHPQPRVHAPGVGEQLVVIRPAVQLTAAGGTR